jgi:hypothetical protein
LIENVKLMGKRLSSSNQSKQSRQMLIAASVFLLLLSSLVGTALSFLAAGAPLEVYPEFSELTLQSPQNATYSSFSLPLYFNVETNSVNRTIADYYYTLNDSPKIKIGSIYLAGQLEVPQNGTWSPFTKYNLRCEDLLTPLEQGPYLLKIYFANGSNYEKLGAVRFDIYPKRTLSFVYSEYSNGTLIVPNSSLGVWYDWVNTSGTQVVNYVIYSDSSNSPVANIVGQHLRLADGSDVFVASALGKMEVYLDANGDCIPQANFAVGQSEILYSMFMNMSEGYSVIPIQKIGNSSVPHYQWGFKYENVYAYLIQPTSSFSLVARLIFDHITLSYDFSVDGNVSNLKTSFDIGSIAQMDMLADSQFSLENLSLSLLYTTATYASKPYSTSVDGQPYNSATATNSADQVRTARIHVGEEKAYDFVFGGNYTLTRSNNITEIYKAKAEAATITSLPVNSYGPAVPSLSFFRDELNLTALFGGSWPEWQFKYELSAFNYRICFPVWEGQQIIHDPTCVGYIASAAVPEFPALASMLALVAVVSMVLFWCRRSRRLANPEK